MGIHCRNFVQLPEEIVHENPFRKKSLDLAEDQQSQKEKYIAYGLMLSACIQKRVNQEEEV